MAQFLAYKSYEEIFYHLFVEKCMFKTSLYRGSPDHHFQDTTTTLETVLC